MLTLSMCAPERSSRTHNSVFATFVLIFARVLSVRSLVHETTGAVFLSYMKTHNGAVRLQNPSALHVDLLHDERMAEGYRAASMLHTAAPDAVRAREKWQY